jgi:hypothetical protein
MHRKMTRRGVAATFTVGKSVAVKVAVVQNMATQVRTKDHTAVVLPWCCGCQGST